MGGLCLALVACGGESPITAEQARALGREAVDRAIALFREGEIRESWREFHRAEAIAADFAAAARAGDEREAPMPVLGGPTGPAGEWVAEWREDYRSAVELSWPVIREAVRQETIDIALLKGFVSEILGADQVARVNREYRAAEPLLKQRRSRQYWLNCDGDPVVCDRLYGALRERIGATTVTTSWTGFRKDYLGIVEARVDVLETVDYQASGAGSAGGFPKSVRVSFAVERRDGGTDRWTRPFSATFDGHPPSRIERAEYPEVRDRHFGELSAFLRDRLSSWPDAPPGGSR